MHIQERWVLIVLIVVLAGLIVLAPGSVWPIEHLFASRSDSLQSALTDAVAENTALKARLAALGELQQLMPLYSGNYQAALVYGRYPFNIKSELLVDVGSDKGIAVDQFAALLPSALSSAQPQPILVGKVVSVTPYQARIETVFDARFKIAVRVGGRGAEALLVGGATPKLTLLTKDTPLAKGDSIYSVAPEFPLGIAIGAVDEAQSSANQLFQEATISLPYDIQSLRVVFIAHAGNSTR
jgi:cell shape-determining protein MreC